MKIPVSKTKLSDSIGYRFPYDHLEFADKLVDASQATNKFGVTFKMTRSDAIRIIMEKGIEKIKEENKNEFTK